MVESRENQRVKIGIALPGWIREMLEKNLKTNLEHDSTE